MLAFGQMGDKRRPRKAKSWNVVGVWWVAFSHKGSQDINVGKL